MWPGCHTSQSFQSFPQEVAGFSVFTHLKLIAANMCFVQTAVRTLSLLGRSLLPSSSAAAASTALPDFPFFETHLHASHAQAAAATACNACPNHSTTTDMQRAAPPGSGPSSSCPHAETPCMDGHSTCKQQRHAAAPACASGDEQRTAVAHQQRRKRPAGRSSNPPAAAQPHHALRRHRGRRLQVARATTPRPRSKLAGTCKSCRTVQGPPPLTSFCWACAGTRWTSRTPA